MVHAIQHRMLGLVKSSKSFLIDEDDIVLIDAGPSKGSARAVLGTLEAIGKKSGSIDLCILTHRHRDHTGGLKALKDMCGFEGPGPNHEDSGRAHRGGRRGKANLYYPLRRSKRS